MSVLRKFKYIGVYKKPQKTIWHKEIGEVFYIGGPFKKYARSNWKNWPSVLKWMKENHYVEVDKKPLTEIEWLNNIKENFNASF